VASARGVVAAAGRWRRRRRRHRGSMNVRGIWRNEEENVEMESGVMARNVAQMARMRRRRGVAK